MVRDKKYLIDLVHHLIKLPRETEWLEFKENYYQEEEIGKYISALSNSAALYEKNFGYIIWGIDDSTHEIVGTSFNYKTKKVGNEEFQNWLYRLLKPRINFEFYKVQIENKNIVILEIPKATNIITKFKNEAYIRVGTSKKSLNEAPLKEKTLWKILNSTSFEENIAQENVSDKEILDKLDVEAYFKLLEIPLPDFEDRIEITNPGVPLVETDRFLDNPPKSRNELLASFLRRIGVCEERGSGFDKIVAKTEEFQLPAPKIDVYNEHTKVTLFSHIPYSKMDKDDKLRACYLHACLKYVNNDFLTNTSLRERFGIEQKNNAMVSRIIKNAIEENLIKAYNEDTAPRYMKYVPYWA